MKRRAIFWTLFSLFSLASLVTIFLLLHPPDYLTLCQKALDAGFVEWQQANNTNGYPNVNGDTRQSFAEAAAYMKDGGMEYIAKYGYVPGLNDDDPKDLVLLYLKKKTRRTWNGDSSPSIFTGPRWMVIGPEFFDSGLPEGGRLEETPVFKARLKRTLDFLKEHDRPHWEAVVREHTDFLNSLGE